MWKPRPGGTAARNYFTAHKTSHGTASVEGKRKLSMSVYHKPQMLAIQQYSVCAMLNCSRYAMA